MTLWQFSGKLPPMPWHSRFDELARYNSGVADGVLYTDEKQQRMKQLQQDYNDMMEQSYIRNGGIRIDL